MDLRQKYLSMAIRTELEIVVIRSKCQPWRKEQKQVYKTFGSIDRVWPLGDSNHLVSSSRVVLMHISDKFSRQDFKASSPFS